MRIVCWNVNGLASLVKSGAFARLFRLDADVICLQETKLSDVTFFDRLQTGDYRAYSHLAGRKGYSGVSILTRLPAKNVETRVYHDRFDTEGRYISATLCNGYTIADLYVPHGRRDSSEIPYKLDCLGHVIKTFSAGGGQKRIVCTDFNIAHKDIDLARAKENRKNTMFTAPERAMVDRMLEAGFTDAYRHCNVEGGQYSWFPYAFRARERNLGWRIDYCFVSNDLSQDIRGVTIRKDIEGSDHCPIVMDIDAR